MPIQSAVYKWVDENGNVHFGGSKPESAQVREVDVKINTYSDTTIHDTKSSVVMYSTQWCGYCKKARKYFRDNNIAFVDYDIETNQKAKKQYDEIQGRGVPVILVGDKRLNGFSEARFKRIYEQGQ